MKDGVVKDNLTDEELDKLFEDSRNAIIKKLAALSEEERHRIDNDPTLERWAGETGNDDEE